MKALFWVAKAAPVKGTSVLAALVLFAGAADAGPLKRLFAGRKCQSVATKSCPASAPVSVPCVGTAAVPRVEVVGASYRVAEVPTRIPDAVPACVNGVCPNVRR